MITIICGVLDKKARAYSSPFFQAHCDVAIRAFRTAVNDPSHPIAKHPEDYSMWLLGTFDDATGIITPHAAPIHVVEALALKQPQIIDNQGSLLNVQHAQPQ